MAKKKPVAPVVSTLYPELTAEENTVIAEARMKGFAAYYPAYPDAKTQAKNTLAGAKSYLKSLKDRGE